MKLPEHIYKELKDISPYLAEMEKTNVFSVPVNYFESLTSRILQATADPFASLPASEPHFSRVPDGYFDHLPATILNRIKTLEGDNPVEELREISPMLYAIQNENVFSVPKGYFESLPGVLFNALHTQTKVVSIRRRTSIWKYAVAAILAGIVAVPALLVTNRSPQQTTVTSEIKTIPAYIKDAIQYKNEKQITDGIAALDDDVIIKYLQATGTNTDDDLLASSIQEKDLPAEEDYLLNDKTLDTYLDQLDLKPDKN